jgi:hypothetical protein
VKTLDLTRKQMTLEEVLKLASAGSVRILTRDGRTYVLEDVEDFEDEVKLLGKSAKFRRFLQQRSKEAATRSLKDYRQSLDRKTQKGSNEPKPRTPPEVQFHLSNDPRPALQPSGSRPGPRKKRRKR